MKINNKEKKKQFKDEILQAKINATDCLAFVAMQKINDIMQREFKIWKTTCEMLNNLWDYTNFCIDNDLIIDISGYSYNLVRRLSNVDVEGYKSDYRAFLSWLEKCTQ